MSNIDKALHEMCDIEKEAGSEGSLNAMHPLFKLFITIWYVAFTVSIPNYKLDSLIFMIIYPLVIFIVWDISFVKCLKRIKVIFVALFLLGIGNLFFSKTVLMGLILMLCLFMKGILSILAVYILAVTTRIEDICNALRIIRVPELIVMVIMLIYRYINILLKETKRITEAYYMLAPNQKGINVKVWGQFAGQLMLRSIDRAHIVYDSMNVRGYEWSVKSQAYRGKYIVKRIDFVWLFGWSIVIVLLRFGTYFLNI
ncbi:MAG: energy-coupling factor transporter transmembrane protein EcfT [Lachnospiraceae bacterium]|nr:energy-coupling factor transporter transmembrane protein EcfT [Lachnospiraceae bacterium]